MASKFRLFNAIADVAPLTAEAPPFELGGVRAAGEFRNSGAQSQLQVPARSFGSLLLPSHRRLETAIAWSAFQIFSARNEAARTH